MARTLNRVQLIGRLGADTELRYTAAGMAVATFSLATNRQWPSKDGTLQEETEWHTIVAWDKLAQICNEHLTKGRLVYIEGRIHTRSWESNGQKQYKTEIVASDMLILDSRQTADIGEITSGQPQRATSAYQPAQTTGGSAQSTPAAPERRRVTAVADDTDPDDLPF